MGRINPKNLLALVFSVGASLTAMRTAAATDIKCNPDAVNTDSRGAITLSCSGAWYFAQPGVCGNSQDAVKMYLSVAQAAILSGKSVQVVTTSDPNCSTHIVFPQLNR